MFFGADNVEDLTVLRFNRVMSCTQIKFTASLSFLLMSYSEGAGGKPHAAAIDNAPSSIAYA